VNSLNEIRHGMAIKDFVAEFDAGTLSLANSGEFSVAPLHPPSRVVGDPTSEGYARWVMSVWQEVTGRAQYQPDVDEAFDVPIDEFLRRPYPYSSGSAAEVGNYLGAIAWMLRRVSPAAGDRVVEYGSGWGLLAMNLAMLGCNVTAVDLNPPSVALLRRRAEAWGVGLDVVEATFLEYAASGVDLIVFFEAFHHCDRPFQLLDQCTTQLRPGGRMILLADAIYDGFYCPWGVRLDGSATFMARSVGWLELGFEREFFYRQLAIRGFEVEDHRSSELGAYGTLIVATRR